MQKINKIFELVCVVFCCSFLSAVLAQFFPRLTLNCVLTASLNSLLVFLYYRFVHPLLENLFAGSVFESTQSDCYKCENDSECAKASFREERK